MKEVVCIKDHTKTVGTVTGWAIGRGPKLNEICVVTDTYENSAYVFYELKGYEGYNPNTESKRFMYNAIYFVDVASSEEISELMEESLTLQKA